MGSVVYRMTFGLPGVRRVVAAMFVSLAISATVCADEPPTGLSLSLDLAKEQAYPGEKVPVTVTLRVSGVAVRNVGYPHIDTHGLSISSIESTDQQNGTEDRDSTPTYRFTGRVTAGKTGSFLVGPAQIECEVLETATGSAAFFGESEPRRVTLRSAPRRLTILPLPAKGKPADFSGAIGRFTVIMTARPTLVRVGDPVTVQTVISGTGDLGSSSCPSISGPGLYSYPSRVRRTDGALFCEQVIVPETATVREIPVVGIKYFDPATENYRTSSSGPLALHVTNATVANRPPVAAKPTPLHSAPDKRSIVILVTTSSAFLLIVAATSVILLRRRSSPSLSMSDHKVTDTIEQLMALAEAASIDNDAERLYSAIFRVLQAYLAARCNASPAGITVDILDTSPCLHHPHATVLSQLFHECDKVRYAREPRTQQQMFLTLKTLHGLLSTSLHHS